MTDFAIIEGILFAFGEEGVDKEQLMLALGIDDEAFNNKIQDYKISLMDSNRGLELVEFGSVYKLITKKELHETISDMLEFNKNRQLSQAALETLAIIAYKQPITRLEIEEIRGVNSDMMCRRLEALDLIQECGRADSVGRPILYEVTNSFMDVFKLTSLKELPEIKIEMLEENNELFK
ncbi:SMC-Scp complex subunit ScpB [Erysipelothrix rhusiopathiae]|uniref:Segregation and condensation protein B n=1 Tax=Erysipelothrix rhusiopathiae ATCC 19414 TaxID=525280 RepID=E7FUD3_ERYRH|nr:SMC-Scp complex subunit ScpB [Erysipelothrix rhusiopathiae]AGN24203.1 segregation and condensation protein B [Erysipelothrix rhusiopathiae SY1027]AMS11023.1 SMC-Scp complex subunit ScpB [Erysipelothrix rhusiopathiae]AOO67521.1 SMC-Scp complex subunit ScpB [Erysipelothrix rhusiopathiae]AWU41614.1 SMC-Scp complex subunit ScpB [Erysipelothrix rhusiopathiae]EFY09736.1 segregation and condensation protein B [Erysipelothrix rhusiopathiae ATCC 19414]